MAVAWKTVKKVGIRIESNPNFDTNSLALRAVAIIPVLDGGDKTIRGVYRSTVTDALESLVRTLAERYRDEINDHHFRSTQVGALSKHLDEVREQLTAANERIRNFERGEAATKDFTQAEKREMAEQLSRLVERLRED